MLSTTTEPGEARREDCSLPLNKPVYEVIGILLLETAWPTEGANVNGLGMIVIALMNITKPKTEPRMVRESPGKTDVW